MSDGFSKKDAVNKKSAYIKGGILGVLSSLAAMLVFALVLLIFNIDRAYAAPFATISVAFGSFIASRSVAKAIGDKGYLNGMIMGIIVFTVITAISLFFGSGLTINTIFHFIIILLSSLAGGIVGVNSKKHKKLI